MNFICYLRISLIRLFRDPIALILTIATPPFFTLFFWLVYNNSTAEINIAAVNDDSGVEAINESQFCGSRLISVLSEASKLNKSINLNFINVKTREDAEGLMRRGSADGMIYIPSDFSASCLQRSKTSWHYSLQKANPLAKEVASLLCMCNTQFNRILSDKNQSLTVELVGQNDYNTVTPFILFIPGMLTFAVIMLVFSVSGVVSREIESGAFIRLRMSALTPFELIIAMGLVHFFVGIIGVLLTLLTIRLTGFSFNGNILIVIMLCSLSILSTIAIGMCIASVARSRHQTLLAACIVMFLFVLFSGVIFPVPHKEIFLIGNHSVSLFDILPTVHLHSGLMGVLFRNAQLADITYDCYALVFLSVVLFAASGFGIKYFVYTEQKGIKKQ